jgi:hypothetical protein
MACGVFAKSQCEDGFLRGCLSEIRFGKCGVTWAPPFLPTAVKGLIGARFARNICKILKAKELKLKILKAKELRLFLGTFRMPRPP